MHVVVAMVVPNALRLKVHGVLVRREVIVALRMCTSLATAANVPADEADPEVDG